jgi:hypothetical protein
VAATDLQAAALATGLLLLHLLLVVAAATAPAATAAVTTATTAAFVLISVTATACPPVPAWPRLPLSLLHRAHCKFGTL